MGIFKKRKFKIRIDGHQVYVSWHKPINEWNPEECDEYQSKLRNAVRKTVSHDIWELITNGQKHDNPKYNQYAENVKKYLIDEYNLEESRDKVEIGFYHMGMLVISFNAQEGVEYPYYYRGIQLKPFREVKAL